MLKKDKRGLKRNAIMKFGRNTGKKMKVETSMGAG
jgi:hypothetical protein